MDFYKFSPDVTSRLSSIVDIINSVGSDVDNSQLKLHTCSVCGNSELVIFDETDLRFECESPTSSRKLPDLMLYGGRMIHTYQNWYIVSEDFINFFRENNFSGARFIETNIMFRRRNKMFPIERKYFIMIITGKAEIDFENMGLVIRFCPECGHYILNGGSLPTRIRCGVFPAVITEGSWDGSDVFGHGHHGICTERFAEAVLTSKLTGFDFNPFEQCYEQFDKCFDIRTHAHLKKWREHKSK